MELKRKPFQGVFNIIRFNRHFYLTAGLVILFLIFIKRYFPETFQNYVVGIACLACLTIAISLIVSFYIYDISDLYELNWFSEADNKEILNINAGFDETSGIIETKFPHSKLTVCDFYNPEKHTEISIKRARKAYLPLENTIQISTNKLPFSDNSFDYALAILSAHEIRDEKERIIFFKEIRRVTKPAGQILITEHLRDLNNFMAYTIGFFHFHSKSSWLRVFEQASLIVNHETKTTPFITTFILQKNGDAS
ncbi:MAG: methyltransferase domain-containing protein [Chitinophagaceae bacterium]|nr:MAG: methyltransferase domain-containing protein [Chitinophagaceae bacterium]